MWVVTRYKHKTFFLRFEPCFYGCADFRLNSFTHQRALSHEVQNQGSGSLGAREEALGHSHFALLMGFQFG